MVVQKDVYDKSRVKRPCNAYIMFVKDFLETKMRNYPSVPDAMRAGTLHGILSPLHCRYS